MRPAGPTSRVEPTVQPQVRLPGFGVKVAPMSAGGLLLRVVLMLSLLLNGLNAAMAGPMLLEMAQPAPAQASAQPPCHGNMPATLHDAPVDLPGQAADDSDHCKIRDCLRSCAQQPSLTAQIAWIPSPPPLWPAPTGITQPTLPSVPLDRITRPPIV